MRKITFALLLVTWQLATGNLTYANNIAVSNSSITGQSTSGSTCKVQFDISWDNSWKYSINYDAAWVFIKYSTDSGTTWKHATLKATTTTPLSDGLGWSYGSNSDVAIIVPTDKKGGFIQRTANATGTYSSTGVQFVWDWGSDTLSDSGSPITASTVALVKVFAVEMVYIPQGTFSLGSGGTETSAFYKYPTTTNTYSVSSEGAINVGTTTDYLYYPSSTYSGDQSGPIPADFPKGFNDFYVMKYEISQDQYKDFLNTLTRTQQGTRVATDISTDAITNIYVMSNTSTISNRNTITCPASGNGTTAPITFSTTRPDRACNFLSWADIAAYADWAGLRPFTELEYEKACRGTATAVANEYAWGTATIVADASLAISGSENGTETITTDVSSGACLYGNNTFTGSGDGGQGPLRCGIFAKSSTTRVQSGASYYGVMELSGNLWERAVTVGNSTGRAFTGLHGDSALDTNGEANVTNWPGTGASGAGFRGGTWDRDATFARVSDCFYAANTNATRTNDYGGRCARTAP